MSLLGHVPKCLVQACHQTLAGTGGVVRIARDAPTVHVTGAVLAHDARVILFVCRPLVDEHGRVRRASVQDDAVLEGGRLPDVAGGDAQQQEAGEARRGQQQRQQQRQHQLLLPGGRPPRVPPWLRERQR